MKKILISLLIAITLLGFSACKKEKKQTESKTIIKQVQKVKKSAVSSVPESKPVMQSDREEPEVDCEEIVKLSYKNTGKVEGLRYMTKACVGNTEYSESINEDLGILMRKKAPATIQFLEKELLQTLGNKVQVNFILKRMKGMLIDEPKHFEELKKSFSQAKDSPLKRRIEKEVLPVFRKLFKKELKVSAISSKNEKDPQAFTGVFVSARLGFEGSGYYVTLKNSAGEKMIFKSKQSPEIAFFAMSKDTGMPAANKKLFGQKFTIYHKPGTEEDARGETVKVNLYLQGELAK